MKITLRPKGNKEEVELDAIQIPDLWHVAEYLKEHEQVDAAKAVLETWGLAHDLKWNCQQFCEILEGLKAAGMTPKKEG